LMHRVVDMFEFGLMVGVVRCRLFISSFLIQFFLSDSKMYKSKKT